MGVIFLGSYLCISILEFKLPIWERIFGLSVGFMYFYIRI